MKKASASGGTLYRGLAMAVILAVLAGCKPNSGATPEGTGTPTSDVLSGKVTITIQDYEFHPDHLKVKAGTTIAWINRDPVFHTIVSDTGLFQSTMLAVGQMYSHTFDTPGTYPYYCEKDGGPGGEGMSGVITVVE
jgi:plastocyanin